MNYHWFPGHMAKTLREMKSDMKLIDLVIEVVDARIPVSSMNPILNDIAKNKPRLIVINKSDMAQDSWNNYWKNKFIDRGYFVATVNAKNKVGIKNIVNEALKACNELILKNEKKGLKNKPIRAMIFGIPNVGKSTVINALSGKTVAKTGNRPGVTKGKQWVRLNKQLELLDTPGVLWHKFEDEDIGKKIAFIGSIKDEIMITEELMYDLLCWLRDNEPDFLEARYSIKVEDPLEIMNILAEKRGCLLKGGKIDYLRIANIFIDEFRNAKLGKITLDRGESYEE